MVGPGLVDKMEDMKERAKEETSFPLSHLVLLADMRCSNLESIMDLKTSGFCRKFLIPLQLMWIEA